MPRVDCLQSVRDYKLDGTNHESIVPIGRLSGGTQTRVAPPLQEFLTSIRSSFSAVDIDRRGYGLRVRYERRSRRTHPHRL